MARMVHGGTFRSRTRNGKSQLKPKPPLALEAAARGIARGVFAVEDPPCISSALHGSRAAISNTKEHVCVEISLFGLAAFLLLRDVSVPQRASRGALSASSCHTLPPSVKSSGSMAQVLFVGKVG